jgi:radical SAM superfamily enzyme with C-terminal helix-hairpin-helix motif
MKYHDLWNERRREIKKRVEVLIIDGYVDEPSLLGVPPYISPEPRLLAGVAEELELEWEYMTIDEVRRFGLPEVEIILVHGGVSVPGRYLIATPMSKREAEEIARKSDGETFLGGPLARYSKVEGYDHYSKKDLCAYFYEAMRGEAEDRWMKSEEGERWLKKGAKVVQRHPFFPEPLIAEISLYRGCVRYFTGGCSFCIEPLYGRPEFREQKDVIEEIGILYDFGVRNFRIGGQSCTISYKARGIGKKEIPEPQVREIERLFDGIWKRCPKIRVLHLDNANPAVIANYPEESKEILRILVKFTTPGNVLALGMESADPKVIEENDLNATPEEVEKAIEIINEVGRERGENGMPKLLPGLNFLAGLRGETRRTYKINLEFLRKIKQKRLWLRRINIRQVLPLRGDFRVRHREEFLKFKRAVREGIDQPMLREILPKGTVMKDVYMEKREGDITFGRQIGTYPLLVGVPYPLELGKFYDVKIVDYGYRSVTGVRYPVKIRETNLKELRVLPEIGDKRASKILMKRPGNKEELNEILGEEIAERVLEYLSFD